MNNVYIHLQKQSPEEKFLEKFVFKSSQISQENGTGVFI